MIRRPTERQEEVDVSSTRRRRAASALPLALVALFAGPAARADDPDLKALEKPIGAILDLIKVAKYDEASRYLDHAAMAKEVLGAAWGSMSEGDRKEFTDGFAYLMQNLSFPKVHDSFQYLSDKGPEPPATARDDGRVLLPYFVVIDHPTKDEEEIALGFVLTRHDDGYQIFDVFVEGESTLAGIREDQVEELLDEGGVELLMKRMREKVAEVKAERAKDG
jgi:phospholipid transport system substrate-binding protein